METAHLTSLFEHATEGIILTQGNGPVVLVNPAAERMFGYTADDTVVVMENAEILQLPKEDFLELMNAEPAVLQKFIRLLTKNVRDKEERLLTLAYSSLRKRVAKALVDVDEKYNKDKSAQIDISRDDIAHYVVTATESLIRTLSDFKQEKLINIVDGKISIINKDKLKNLVY